MLIKRGLIPEKYDINKQVKARKDIDPKYYFLKQICSNPKKDEIHDLETDKVVLIQGCLGLESKSQSNWYV